MTNNKSTTPTNEGLSSEESFFEDDIDYGTPIRSRKRFTFEETQILESYFKENTRPTADIKKALAEKFETGSDRIQIWFQNRRAKEKKLTAQEKSPKRNEEGSPGPSTESKKRKHSKHEERKEPVKYLRPNLRYEFPIYPPEYFYYSPQEFLDPRQIDPGVNIAPYMRVPEEFNEERDDLRHEEEDTQKSDVKGKKKASKKY